MILWQAISLSSFPLIVNTTTTCGLYGNYQRTKTRLMSYNGEMRKRYTAAYKAKIVTELLKEEKTLAQLSSETGVSTKQLTRWKNYTLAEMPRLFESKSEQMKEKYDTKINELYAEIGRLTTQVNWLKKKSGLNLEPD